MPTTPLITAVAHWTWAPTTGSAITLNDLSAWPRYEVDWPIRGLRALPDSPDNRAPNTEAAGEEVYDSYVSGKTITITGRCFGRSLVERIAGDDALVAAFGADITTGKVQGGRMIIAPNSALSTQQMTFTAVCRDAETIEARPRGPGQVPSPFFSEFTIDLRLADPRFYKWNGTTATDPRW